VIRQELAKSRRPKLWSATGTRNDDLYVAEVDLTIDDHHSKGTTRAPAWQELEYSAVVHATLAALEEKIDGVQLEDGYLLRMGRGLAAVVVLRWQEDTYTGSAFVKRHVEDAIARATLDALNRIITNDAR
jgi:hypothetical protein